MARYKKAGKHASREPETAATYSRNKYGSGARSGARGSADSRFQSALDDRSRMTAHGATSQYNKVGTQRTGAQSASSQYEAMHYDSRVPSSHDARFASGGSYPPNSYPSATAQSRRNPWRVVLVVSIIVLVAALVALGAIVFQYISQQRAYDDLEQYAGISDTENIALSDLTVDWEALRAINPDIVAWIYVPNTPINYPVVQGEDNEEYLHKAFDGSTGWLASAGTIFLDSNNAADLSDRNSALYGHHMNDGSMFATFSDWQNSDEFNAHRDIYVLTPEGNYRLKTFALVKTTGSDALVQTGFASDESYQAYIQDKLDRSVVTQQGEVLSAQDVQQSMLFSTCEYSQNDGRAVVFAAVVETTVSDNPYVSAVTEGTTGLSSDQATNIDGEYKEAA